MAIEKRRRYSVVTVLAVSAAGCAGPNVALKDAEESYDQARVDPQVASLAPEVLREAEQSLSQAKQADDQEKVEHLAYMAQQQVAIALAEARRRAAEAQVQQSLERQDEIVTEALADEAAKARAEAQRLEEELAALKAQKTERGYVLTLEDVLFEVDGSDLKPGAQHSLYQVVTFLKDRPEQTVTIEGHTDSTASESYNLRLSEHRTHAVANFLVQNGITAERITTRGYGESYPKAPNDTVAGRQQNRRVEIVFAGKAEPSA